MHRLEAAHGPLLFHQSGGCCDGSSPMCYPRGDFLLGEQDVYLGSVGAAGDDEGTPVYIGAAQYGYWAHTHLTIDVVAGRGAGFSLEAPEGVRFLTRSRLFTDEEHAGVGGGRCAPQEAPGRGSGACAIRRGERDGQRPGGRLRAATGRPRSARPARRGRWPRTRARRRRPGWTT